jgi:aminoglycoside phosphotransferase (APT) family kinase protein
MSVAGSAPPGMEAGRVGYWLADDVEGLAGPGGDRVCLGGRSNLTCRVADAAGAAYALRRPPTGEC